MLEFQLTPNSLGTIHLWLSALLGISCLLTVLFLLHFLSRRFVLSPKYSWISKLLLAVLASFQILAWQLYLYSESHDRVALWCFALAIVGGAMLWRLSNGLFSMQPFLVRTLPFAIVLISFVELAGFAHATKRFSETALMADVATTASDLSNPGQLVEKTSICGSTDIGKPIKLFERQVTAQAFREYVEMFRSSHSTVCEKAMLRAQPFVQSNCHGWVFTQGQHILKGEDVQLILEDNSYTEVSKPQSNDVVVYRSDEGTILHTGVVRGALEGATMVESKWGIGALYMHVAEEQPYSQNIKYYRTDRPSHDILTISTDQTSETGTELLLADQAVNDGIKSTFFDAHLSSSQRK